MLSHLDAKYHMVFNVLVVRGKIYNIFFILFKVRTNIIRVIENSAPPNNVAIDLV